MGVTLKSLRDVWNHQVEQHGVSGEMKILHILIGVLDALKAMQEIDISHRDVKDDNIIATDSGSNVTLIDFGFCKGTGQPKNPDSFQNIGAPCYAPPSKLKHPSIIHATHDVFSVGVVAYLLLTNKYPWRVSKGLDKGHLIDSMSSDNLIPVNQINNLVSAKLSSFISKLLIIDDDSRPNLKSRINRSSRDSKISCIKNCPFCCHIN